MNICTFEMTVFPWNISFVYLFFYVPMCLDVKVARDCRFSLFLKLQWTANYGNIYSTCLPFSLE